MAAVELMVMDVETRASGMPSNSVSMSSSEQMATPTLPTSPRARGWSESSPICVGRSNATESPVWPLREQIAIARVGLRGGAETGVLPHGPELAAVHRRVDAAREGKFARARPGKIRGSHAPRSAGAYAVFRGMPERVVACDAGRAPCWRAARSSLRDLSWPWRERLRGFSARGATNETRSGRTSRTSARSCRRRRRATERTCSAMPQRSASPGKSQQEEHRARGFVEELAQGAPQRTKESNALARIGLLGSHGWILSQSRILWQSSRRGNHTE